MHSPTPTRARDPQLDADPAEPQPSAALALSTWMFGVAGLVFVILVVGGATRLTESGLSIVDWEPVTGVIPPLNGAAWQSAFDAYRTSPEYELVNQTMSLGEFKTIYLWEYAHRLLGRLLGVAIVVPFLWFLAKRSIPRGYSWRIAGLAVLVGVQGAIGWWMVASGLVDRPDVAHERLALHLVTALVLLCALVWTALDLRALATGDDRTGRRPARWFWPFTLVLFAQITLGAFVAGLDAGHMYNTWPTMQGQWRPDGLTMLHPVWTNVVDNPIAVQFLHRWLAVVIVAVAVIVADQLRRAGDRSLATALTAAVFAQFVLGVLTLVHAVPIPLGVAHQAGAVVLLVVVIVAGHRSSRTAHDVPDADGQGQRSLAPADVHRP